MVNKVYRYPCVKFKNAKYLTSDEVKLHLYRKNFKNEWIAFDGYHAENKVGGYDDHHMEVMLNDSFRYEEDTIMDRPDVNAEEASNNMLQANQQPLQETTLTPNHIPQDFNAA